MTKRRTSVRSRKSDLPVDDSVEPTPGAQTEAVIDSEDQGANIPSTPASPGAESALDRPTSPPVSEAPVVVEPLPWDDGAAARRRPEAAPDWHTIPYEPGAPSPGESSPAEAVPADGMMPGTSGAPPPTTTSASEPSLAPSEPEPGAGMPPPPPLPAETGPTAEPEMAPPEPPTSVEPAPVPPPAVPPPGPGEMYGRLTPLGSTEEIVTKSILNAAGEIDPFGRGTIVPVVPTKLSDEARAQVRRNVTQEMVDELSREVKELFQGVERDLSSNRALANEALQKLNEARTILLSDRGLYPDAELRVEQVKVMLRQSKTSVAEAQKYAGVLVGLNVIMILVLLALLVFDRAIAQTLVNRGVSPGFPLPLTTDNGRVIPLSMVMYFLPWYTMLWGGIGGAIGALVDLLRYRGRREYDAEYNSYYLVWSIMGIVLGSIVYYLFTGGFFLVGAISQNPDIQDPASQILTATSPILILVAIAVGIGQSTVYEMLDRVVRTVTGTKTEETSTETTVTTSEATTVKPPASRP